VELVDILKGGVGAVVKKEDQEDRLRARIPSLSLPQEDMRESSSLAKRKTSTVKKFRCGGCVVRLAVGEEIKAFCGAGENCRGRGRCVDWDARGKGDKLFARKKTEGGISIRGIWGRGGLLQERGLITGGRKMRIIEWREGGKESIT